MRAAAYRPATVEAVLSDLVFQTLFYHNPDRTGLDELAAALLQAFSGRLTEARARLSNLADQYREQPLCHFYLFAVHYQTGDVEAARNSLGRVSHLRPEDPVVNLLRGHFDGKPVEPTTQSTRLAFLRTFAGATLLRNAYQLAVGAMFEAIRETRPHLRHRRRKRRPDLRVAGFARAAPASRWLPASRSHSSLSPHESSSWIRPPRATSASRAPSTPPMRRLRFTRCRGNTRSAHLGTFGP